MRSRVLLAVLLIASSASAASAQTSGGSRPMSATVITTWVAHDGELALLVLWRGSPGWYSRGGSNADDPAIVSIRRSASAGAFLQGDVPLSLPGAPAPAQLDAATRARITEYIQGAMTRICREATAP